MNKGRPVPRKLKVLVVTHGNSDEGPTLNAPDNDTLPIFKPDDRLKDCDTPRHLSRYLAEVLPTTDFFKKGNGKIDELVFTGCRIADTAGGQAFWDGVRQEMGIQTLIAGKQFNVQRFWGFRQKHAITLLSYEDPTAQRQLPKSTPVNEVLHISAGQ